MPRLTLRTLLAYIDDTLEPAEARALGKKVADSDEAKQLVERIKKVTRRRGLSTPVATDPDDETADPNTVAEYLDNALDSPTLKQVEETCLESDVHLAEVAACHQILTLVLTEPVRVPPRAHRRMYALVPPPASVPKRRPNKTLPVGGAPPNPEHTEDADADAALLLGMKRYSSANTWAARFALFGAAAVLFLLLSAAVLLSLPPRGPAPPDVSPGHSYALAPREPLVPEAPMPRPKEKPAPPKKPKEPDTLAVLPVAPPPHAVGTKPPDVHGLGDPIPLPNNEVREIAVILKPQTKPLIVTQLPKTGEQWIRVMVKDDPPDAVMSGVPVMALPGYKAELSVDRRVQLRLWGNVPEQLPYRVLESRIKLHSPPAGFDADITLLAGRIYLKAERKDGAKVRLRLASEVWDVTLPDAESNVLAELISWYEPGTVYAAKGGSHPKREARVAVAFGSAAFEAPGNRFKKIPKLTRGQQVTWDSVTDRLSDAVTIEPALDGLLLNPDPINPQTAELNRNVTRLLSNAADRVATRDAVAPTIRVLVGPELPDGVAERDRELVARLGIYAHAALADSSADGVATLTPLVDVLTSQLPWLARQAVVTALVNWVARDRGNTALLREFLVTDRMMAANDADTLLRLLRCFVAPTNPDPQRLDELVEPVPPRDRSLLGDPSVPIREAALWNIMVVRLESWVPLPLGVNVGAVGSKVDSDEYKKFLADGKRWIDEVKKRQPPPKK
jgi:hypothetical protein